MRRPAQRTPSRCLAADGQTFAPPDGNPHNYGRAVYAALRLPGPRNLRHRALRRDRAQ